MAKSMRMRHGDTRQDVKQLRAELNEVLRRPPVIVPAPVWRTPTGATYIRTQVRQNESSGECVPVSAGANTLFWKNHTYHIIWEHGEV